MQPLQLVKESNNRTTPSFPRPLHAAPYSPLPVRETALPHSRPGLGEPLKRLWMMHDAGQTKLLEPTKHFVQHLARHQPQTASPSSAHPTYLDLIEFYPRRTASNMLSQQYHVVHVTASKAFSSQERHTCRAD